MYSCLFVFLSLPFSRPRASRCLPHPLSCALSRSPALSSTFSLFAHLCVTVLQTEHTPTHELAACQELSRDLYMCVRTHAHRDEYTHRDVYRCVYTCSHTHTHTHSHAADRALPKARMSGVLPAPIHVYTHTHTHIQTYEKTYIYVYTHTHTYTH